MAPEELTRAIVMPALHAGIRVEPELAAQMIADMKGEPGALPMLQFTLKDLFEAAPRRAGDEVTLTLQAYLQRDGLYGALEKHAQAVLRSLTDEQRALARLLFAQLINVRSQALITRRIVPIETLLAAHTDRMAAEQVLHHLAEARLITTDDSGHQRTATLAHEKLIDSWSWLQQLIIEAGDRLRLQHQLDDDARTWERHQRDASYLYVGARLIGMQAQLARHQLTLAEPAHTFFQQSSEAQVNAERAREAARQRELILERRARKQQQWLTLVFAGLFTVAALVLGRPYALAWRARGEMVTVPAGPVVFGAREPDSNWSELKETALPSVPAFQLERYEVSNWQYRLCVDAGRCTTPILPTDFYDEAHLNHPVAGVSAVQAADYCRWLGRRLPTEVEWERAARGPNGQPWPWGDAPLTPERANVSFEGPPQDSKPVDSYPAGASVNPTGIFNLAGNVWEWTASYAQLAEAAYDPTFIWDGKGASLSKEMGLIQRGGGWEDPLMRVTYRFEYIGFEAIKSTGFRCAADR
jgi:formylglycine-generating enzyme required for sulfatase activity